jgi:hypothetical protein
MQFLVCIAGLPIEVVDEIRASPAVLFTEDKDNAPIARPVRPPFGFRDGMSEGYLQDIVDRLRAIPATAETSVLLIYVNYPHPSTRQFLRRFYPFALTGAVEPFYPDAAPKNMRRSALKKYVKTIERRGTDLRKRARIVRDVLSGRNFTPLLLPVRNFRSSILRAQVDALFDTLGTDPDPRTSLNVAAAAIGKRHPLREAMVGRERDRWFEDDRNLRFKSPGRNRHGIARILTERHQPECLIAGRVRLGGPFDAHFHYDCDYERGGIDKSYPNCHDADIVPESHDYVNIAPSDYVR